MKIGDRVKTNRKCDFPYKLGTVLDMSETGVCLVIQLDDGLRILTMDYAVNPLEGGSMSIKRNGCSLYDKGKCSITNEKCNYIPKKCTKLNNDNINK